MASPVRFLTVSGLLAFGFGCGSEPEPFEPWTLEDLTSEQGISIRIPEFTLQPGEESQTCYFIDAPDINNGQPYFISKVHAAQNPGTHHLNIFRVKTIIGLDPAQGEPIEIGPYHGTVSY